MSKSSFEELLCKIKPRLLRKNTKMRMAIPTEELRYLASGNSLTDIEEMYSVGQPTAGNIVRRVCTVIWDIMKEECIPIPTTEKWYEIVKCFETRAHFPHCIGAVDGKHIIIIRLYRSGSLFFNYKHYFSILLLALADSNYQFVCVDVGSYGKDSDCSIFKNSSLWTALVQHSRHS
ncbi:protein ANTAGONIST OF LIKE HETEROCHROMATIN PROTEIN 1 [Cryptotermes secundus]|uniref:protein ANTAGONIST OF LIKE HETEROCHROMATIN PROTEIN 1 n=1 Tax=Cryptotermes secundus TaxID=105785 RepID=UPI000CD7B396|nr:protein ANTAGONIST OF LIKE HETEROCHROMATIN PROTEIN 1 [Cryptotermes secundus]